MKKKLELNKETVALMNGSRGGNFISNNLTCNVGGLECLQPPTTEPSWYCYTHSCPEEPKSKEIDYMCFGSDYPGCIS